MLVLNKNYFAKTNLPRDYLRHFSEYVKWKQKCDGLVNTKSNVITIDMKIFHESSPILQGRFKFFFFFGYRTFIFFYPQAYVVALDSPCRDLRDKLFYTLFPSATNFMVVLSGLVGSAERGGLWVSFMVW